MSQPVHEGWIERDNRVCVGSSDEPIQEDSWILHCVLSHNKRKCLREAKGRLETWEKYQITHYTLSAASPLAVDKMRSTSAARIITLPNSIITFTLPTWIKRYAHDWSCPNRAANLAGEYAIGLSSTSSNAQKLVIPFLCMAKNT